MDRMYAPPPPRKVRSGQLGDDALRVETSRGDAVVAAWRVVCCIFAARLEPEQASEQRPEGAGPNPLARRPDPRQKKRTEATDASAALSRTPSLILDLYLEGEASPLRFETTGTNMRSLLGAEAGYSGDLNFTALLKRLAALAPHALHESAARALAKGRSALSTLPTRDDLYLASRRACKEMEEKRAPATDAPSAPAAPPAARPAREVSMQWVEVPPAFQNAPPAPPAARPRSEALSPPVGPAPRPRAEALSPPVGPAPIPRAEALSPPVGPAPRPRTEALSPPVGPAPRPRAEALSPPVGPAPRPRAEALSPPVGPAPRPRAEVAEEGRPFPAPPPFPPALAPAPRPPAPGPMPPPRTGPISPGSLPADMFSEMRAAERQSNALRLILMAVVAIFTAWAVWVGLLNATP